MLPRRKPAKTPFAPLRTSSSAGGSLTIVKSTSACAATSRGFAPSLAPARTRSSAFAAERFQTTSGNPALRKLWPIGLPIKPSPISPTVGFIFASLIIDELYPWKDASRHRRRIPWNRGGRPYLEFFRPSAHFLRVCAPSGESAHIVGQLLPKPW